MATIKSSSHPKYPHLTLYETNGKRYVSAEPLMWTHEGMTQYRTKHCDCCRKLTDEPYGPTARTFEEAIEFGWVLLETDYETWLKNAQTNGR